jgi:TRAP-type C4-dicarboxylate transport system substrate-binding protein
MTWLRFALVGWLMLPLAAPAQAETIKLKAAYFSSDRTTTYLATIKPFADGVNAEAADLIDIEVGFSGAFGKNPLQQLQLVLDGQVDMAFIIPGYTPQRFRDNTVIELPGLFRNIREASLVYTRLVAAGALQGYEDLFVIGAYATEPESIHSRPKAASLDDLKGKRIRVNNPMQAAGLEALGIVPHQLPINQTAAAIGADKLDGALVSPAPLVEFGISRVTPHHYLLGVGSAPLAIVMSKKKFDALPKRAQEVIRKFSGEWTAERYIATYTAENKQAIEQFKTDAGRTVVFPPKPELDRANAAFAGVVGKWLEKEPRNRELLLKARAELDKIRSESVGARAE